MEEELNNQNEAEINPLPSEGNINKNPEQRTDNLLKKAVEKISKNKCKGKLVTEEQIKLNNLRLAVNASLAKLTVASTKEVGLNELQDLITNNATPQALKIYLGQLAEGCKDLNSSGKELYVLLLGHVVKTYKKQLVGPRDKSSMVLKTVVHVCDIIRKYLTVILQKT